MATTSRGIPLLDGSEQIAPFQAFYNGIAEALDSALDDQEETFGKRANFMVASSTEMAQMESDGSGWEGLHVYSTTDKREWVWVGGSFKTAPFTVIGEFSYRSPFTNYSAPGDRPTAFREGNWVCIQGTAGTGSSSTIAGNTGVTMFTLSSEFRPYRRASARMQGSGGASWVLMVDSSGEVTASRYSGGTHSSVWMPFTLTFPTTPPEGV